MAKLFLDRSVKFVRLWIEISSFFSSVYLMSSGSLLVEAELRDGLVEATLTPATRAKAAWRGTVEVFLERPDTGTHLSFGGSVAFHEGGEPINVKVRANWELPIP